MSNLNKRNNQKSKDYTGHAPESGEPTETGFSHGHPIDRGDSKNKQASKDRSPTGKNFESGRQGATTASGQ